MPHLSIYSYHYNYRRLLFHLRPTLTTASPPPPYTSSDHHDQSGNHGSSNNNTFDSNVVMVLSVLLCALICSLGLNSLRRCALRCSTWMSSDSRGSNPHPSARLANMGVKKKALKTFPVVVYSAELDLPGIDAECVICLSEYCPGDQVRLLPRCHHGFHARCIDKWLSSHSSCPTCRQCLLETSQRSEHRHAHGAVKYFSSPLILLASWISFGMMVTLLAWIEHRFVSSNSPTRYA